MINANENGCEKFLGILEFLRNPGTGVHPHRLLSRKVLAENLSAVSLLDEMELGNKPIPITIQLILPKSRERLYGNLDGEFAALQFN
jgi:hypothetical protein